MHAFTFRSIKTKSVDTAKVKPDIQIGKKKKEVGGKGRKRKSETTTKSVADAGAMTWDLPLSQANKFVPKFGKSQRKSFQIKLSPMKEGTLHEAGNEVVMSLEVDKKIAEQDETNTTTVDKKEDFTQDVASNDTQSNEKQPQEDRKIEKTDALQKNDETCENETDVSDNDPGNNVQKTEGVILHETSQKFVKDCEETSKKCEKQERFHESIASDDTPHVFAVQDITEKSETEDEKTPCDLQISIESKKAENLPTLVLLCQNIIQKLPKLSKTPIAIRDTELKTNDEVSPEGKSDEKDQTIERKADNISASGCYDNSGDDKATVSFGAEDKQDMERKDTNDHFNADDLKTYQEVKDIENPPTLVRLCKNVIQRLSKVPESEDTNALPDSKEIVDRSKLSSKISDNGSVKENVQHTLGNVCSNPVDFRPPEDSTDFPSGTQMFMVSKETLLDCTQPFLSSVLTKEESKAEDKTEASENESAPEKSTETNIVKENKTMKIVTDDNKDKCKETGLYKCASISYQ